MNKNFSFCNTSFDFKKQYIFYKKISFTLLKNWSLIFISGLDSKKYLQSQITINISLLKKYQHILCAHCNYHGKVGGILRLFHYNNGYAYIQRKNIGEFQIQELKKYSIFSDVNIIKLKKKFLLGVIGLNVRDILSSYFSHLPNVKQSIIHINEVTLLWFQDPIERFLLILNKKDFIKLKLFFLDKFIIDSDSQWLLLDMESGFPIIDKKTLWKFLPQSINLHTLKGIDYQKGCYLGQEIISRIYFHNVSYKKLYYLVGFSNIIPNIFFIIEMYDGVLWHKVGKVFFILHIKKNFFVMQCILNNKIELNKMFRLYVDKNSRFKIK